MQSRVVRVRGSIFSSFTGSVTSVASACSSYTGSLVRVSSYLGKIIQSGGSQIFNVENCSNFVRAVILKEVFENAFENPVVLTAASIALLADVMVTIRTRVPSMQRKFKKIQQRESKPCCQCSELKDICEGCGINRHAVANCTTVTSTLSSWSSVGWAALNTALFTVKFLTFLSHLLRIPGDTTGAKYGAYASVAYITSSATFSYLALNIEKASKTTKELTKIIHQGPDDGNWKLDKHAKKTAALLAVYIVPTLLFALYSTIKSLHQVPGLEHTEDSKLEYAGFISVISVFFTTVFSNAGQMYNYFSKTPLVRVDHCDPINVANIINSIFVTGANAMGVASKLKERYDIDMFEWFSILPSVALALVAGFVNYIFANQAYEETLAREMVAEREVEEVARSPVITSLSGAKLNVQDFDLEAGTETEHGYVPLAGESELETFTTKKDSEPTNKAKPEFEKKTAKEKMRRVSSWDPKMFKTAPELQQPPQVHNKKLPIKSPRPGAVSLNQSN